MAKDYKMFEDDNLNDKDYIIESLNQTGEHFQEMISIDSKVRTEFSSKRDEVTNKFKENYRGNFNPDKRSSIKGDKLLSGDKLVILDDKNYDRITGLMKFPTELGLSSDDYTKGIDSNIKYSLEILDIDFSTPEAEKIFDFVKQQVYKTGRYKKLQPINIQLGTISSDQFSHFISYNELGFCYDGYKLSKEKYFICANRSDRYKYLKHIDFTQMTDGSAVEVGLNIDTRFNYVYLTFKNAGEVIYIVSQRHSLDRANCSFMPNSKFKILEHSKKSI